MVYRTLHLWSARSTMSDKGRGEPAIAKESPNRQYVSFSAAFDFFNRKLFAGKLPVAFITLQRQPGSRGYYAPAQFERRARKSRRADEVALNPATFSGRTDGEILSTLVHEMVHHWQKHFGRPGRGRYHNREWAAKMEALGLIPSDTGRPGGKRVGDRMTHYVALGGAFELACRELLAGGIGVEWQARAGGGDGAARRNRGKTRYHCPECGLNAWAKSDVTLLCGGCKEALVEGGQVAGDGG